MKLKDGYNEVCNCGYKGSFVDYIKSLGLKPEDLDKLINKIK